jgi:hypothetical protein
MGLIMCSSGSTPDDELDTQIAQLLCDIESQGREDRDYSARLVMLDILSLIDHALPEVGRAACAVARRHFERPCDRDLQSALDQCLAYRDSRQDEIGFRDDDKLLNGISAVIIALYPRRDDFVLSIEYFLAAVNMVEPHRAEQIELMRKRFFSPPSS